MINWCKLVFYLLKKILKPQLKHQRRQQQQPFPTTKGYNNLVIWSSWVRLKSWKHGNLKKNYIYCTSTWFTIISSRIKWK